MHRHVSLAINLKDGYKNTPIPSGSAIRIRLDDEWSVPVYKEGGWFVFTDMTAGEHRLELQGSIFIPEQILVTIPENQTGYLEIHLSMQPAPAYPFPAQTTKIRGTLRNKGDVLPDTELFVVSMQDSDMLKVAEDDASAGKRQVRLYSASKRVLLNIPGVFFIVDNGSNELCSVTDAQEDMFTLAEPLRFSHKRGIALRAARRFKSDKNGAYFAALDYNTETLTTYISTEKGFLEKKLTVMPGEMNDMDVVI